MKKITKITLFFLCLMTLPSCLKMGLDDLPVYDEVEVSNVRFEYRWWDETDKRLRVVEINTDKNFSGTTISCILSVPDANNTFTQDIRSNVNLGNIVCSLDISSAARVQSIDGSPALGTPGNFSAREFIYRVTAADGKTQKDWTIIISDLRK